jgi:hypothetical protein
MEKRRQTMTLDMTTVLAIHTHMTGIGRSLSLANPDVLLSRENSTMTSLAHGMMPGGNVCDALMRILRLLRHDWLAVLRSLDSNCATGDLAKALQFHHIAYDLNNENVCLSIETLQKAVDEGVFTGFDEVWIVAGSPPAFNLASFHSATSDSADFSLDLPKDLPSAIKQTDCVLILGDGCGLNYAVAQQQQQLLEELAGAGQ